VRKPEKTWWIRVVDEKKESEKERESIEVKFEIGDDVFTGLLSDSFVDGKRFGKVTEVADHALAVDFGDEIHSVNKDELFKKKETDFVYDFGDKVGNLLELDSYEGIEVGTKLKIKPGYNLDIEKHSEIKEIEVVGFIMTRSSINVLVVADGDRENCLAMNMSDYEEQLEIISVPEKSEKKEEKESIEFNINDSVVVLPGREYSFSKGVVMEVGDDFVKVKFDEASDVISIKKEDLSRVEVSDDLFTYSVEKLNVLLDLKEYKGIKVGVEILPRKVAELRSCLYEAKKVQVVGFTIKKKESCISTIIQLDDDKKNCWLGDPDNFSENYDIVGEPDPASKEKVER